KAHARLGPPVYGAAGASVLSFTAVLPRPRYRVIFPGLPLKTHAAGEELPARSLERAAREDVVGDLLPDALPAGLAGVRRYEAHGLHLVRPLVVVVAAAAGLPEVLLPVVHHLVDEGGEDFGVAPPIEGPGVERHFVRLELRVAAALEAVGGVVATGAGVSLERDEGLRQRTREEFAVEKIGWCLLSIARPMETLTTLSLSKYGPPGRRP